jgi:hypothetical protein
LFHSFVLSPVLNVLGVFDLNSVIDPEPRLTAVRFGAEATIMLRNFEERQAESWDNAALEISEFTRCLSSFAAQSLLLESRDRERFQHHRTPARQGNHFSRLVSYGDSVKAESAERVASGAALASV